MPPTASSLRIVSPYWPQPVAFILLYSLALADSISDNTISDCEDLFYRPSYITNHTQFRSYGTFISRATQGNGCIRFNGHDLSSVVLPSVGSYTTIEELEDDYANGFSGECNVYFMY